MSLSASQLACHFTVSCRSRLRQLLQASSSKAQRIQKAAWVSTSVLEPRHVPTALPSCQLSCPCADASPRPAPCSSRPLSWDINLARQAQQHAEKCVYGHSDSAFAEVGENIVSGCCACCLSACQASHEPGCLCASRGGSGCEPCLPVSHSCPHLPSAAPPPGLLQSMLQSLACMPACAPACPGPPACPPDCPPDCPPACLQARCSLTLKCQHTA